MFQKNVLNENAFEATSNTSATVCSPSSRRTWTEKYIKNNKRKHDDKELKNDQK